MTHDADALRREQEYHDKLYSGFAQKHFAKPAVRAFREHLAARIVRTTGLRPDTSVLSLGCGIGDTELLLAPHLGQITGIDISPNAIAQAQTDAERLDVENVRFLHTGEPPAGERFDVVLAIFFLHHLTGDALATFPERLRGWLAPGGRFYSLDPSAFRLSGAVGRVLIPSLVKRYQTEDERELNPGETAGLFASAGFDVRIRMYDFGSTPLAGLLPSWRFGYQLARIADNVLLRYRAFQRRGSNFELLASVRG